MVDHNVFENGISNGDTLSEGYFNELWTAMKNITTGHDHDGTDSKQIADIDITSGYANFNITLGHDHDGVDSKQLADMDSSGTYNSFNITGGHEHDGIDSKKVDDTYTWNKTLSIDYYPSGTTITLRSIIPLSSTLWLGCDSDSIWRSTDAGANWTSVSTFNADYFEICHTDSTRIIAWDLGVGQTSSSTDSGLTWTNVSPPNFYRIYDISYPTSSLAIAVGDATVGVGIWRSTNGGVSWSQLGTGASVMRSVSMWDNTYGFAIGSSNIYYTSDGGLTWADTGGDVDDATEGWVMAVSSTEYIAVGYTDVRTIQKGDNTSADGIRVIGLYTTGSACKPVKFNGDIYFIANGDGNALLCKSDDDGDTWYVRHILSSYIYPRTISNRADLYSTTELFTYTNYSPIMIQRP